MKRCKVCGETKADDAFHIDSFSVDGLRYQCKECACAYTTKWRNANKEHCRKVTKVWQQKNRDKRAATSRRWQKNHPEQYAAMKLKHREDNREKYRVMYRVHKAIKRGDLFPQPCEVCGAKAVAHHDDYDKPYKVRWLCPVHHYERHEEMRMVK